MALTPQLCQARQPFAPLAQRLQVWVFQRHRQLEVVLVDGTSQRVDGGLPLAQPRLRAGGVVAGGAGLVVVGVELLGAQEEGQRPLRISSLEGLQATLHCLLGCASLGSRSSATAGSAGGLGRCRAPSQAAALSLGRAKAGGHRPERLAKPSKWRCGQSLHIAGRADAERSWQSSRSHFDWPIKGWAWWEHWRRHGGAGINCDQATHMTQHDRQQT